MTTPLSAALSPSIQAQLPPHVQSLEDLALTSPRDIAAKKGWEWIDVARRHLARTYIRRIERTSDAELTVVLRASPDVPRDHQDRLLALCAVAITEFYQDEPAVERVAEDRLRVTLAFASDFDRNRFRQFTARDLEPPGPVGSAKAEEGVPAAIPENLFDPVVGYEDLKDAFRTALDPARKPVHIHLVGPPASAKTQFLHQLERLQGAFMTLGGTTSKAGLAEDLLEAQPAYLLIDELDKMDREDFSVLLSLCETGRVAVTKYRRRQAMTLAATRVFAAANTDEKIPREVLSRFLRFRLRPYTREEFVEVVSRLLPAAERATAELAAYIAAKLGARLDVADVRDAIRLARLAQSEAEVDGLLATMRRFL